MRFAIDIPDAMYCALKGRAVAEGASVQEMVLRAVEEVLGSDETVVLRRLMLPVVKSRRPGSLDLDSERIYDLIGFP
jgi:hypothetical protein